MKTTGFFAMAFVAAMSVSLMAQQVNTPSRQDGSADASADAGSGRANDSAKATYATEGRMGFGDEASSHAYEMSSVTGELQGKLDAKNAKVGDQVVLRTADKVQTSDGTVIPRGARLEGHITEVQAKDSAHGVSQMAIAFDHAELKNGQSIAVHTLIQGVSPSAAAMRSFNTDDRMGDASMGGMGGDSGGGRGGRSGGGLAGDAGGLAGGTLPRTAATTSATPTAVGDRAGAADPNTPGTVELAGRGNLDDPMNAHQQALARMVPHPTKIPGVMLAGSASASGTFSMSGKNLLFESGTQMQLGIVADR